MAWPGRSLLAGIRRKGSAACNVCLVARIHVLLFLLTLLLWMIATEQFESVASRIGRYALPALMGLMLAVILIWKVIQHLRSRRTTGDRA